MNNAGMPIETIHASCVAIGGRAVLIAGRSGAGKSDLALRLIDRGAALISDDYTLVRRAGDRLLASAPSTIAGKIEVRGIGLAEFAPLSEAPVALLIDLDRPPERLPEAPAVRRIADRDVPFVGLAALECSAPIKVEMALSLFGLTIA